MKNLPFRQRSHRWMRSLGVRLATLMAAALLPLGIVAYLQTSNLAHEAQGRTEEALMGQSLRAAAGEIRLISYAQGVVAGIAQIVPDVMNDDAACSKLMRDTIADMPDFSLLSFVPASGRMTCSSTNRDFDYSTIPLFDIVSAYRAPAFTMSRNGPISGTSVMGVIRPVFDRQGGYLGYASAWLPHEKLQMLKDADEITDPNDVQFWTFNREGDILTASMGIDNVGSVLPTGITLDSFIGKEARVFTASSVLGAKTTYAVLPLVKEQLYLMSSWPSKSAKSAMPFGLGPTWFPILLWIAGLGMSVWAAEILVVRHVRALHLSILYFTRGQRRHTEVSLKGAPLELREMADAYSTMTDDIMRNEASLEDEVHQKEVLLREVHHRVKNNLQLIASIMNMQIRQARTPEAKGLLKGLQERIMSLATIHRGLYQTTGLSDIYAQELLSDITRQTVNIATGPGRQIDVSTDFDDIRLTPDQAVPLSLLLTEALTNAIKYARAPNGGRPKLAVSMKREPNGLAVLDVTNTVFEAPAMTGDGVLNTSTGLGAQLLVAFAQQIGGTLRQAHEAESYRLQVVFKITDLLKAENRAAPPDEDDTGNEPPTAV